MPRNQVDMNKEVYYTNEYGKILGYSTYIERTLLIAMSRIYVDINKAYNCALKKSNIRNILYRYKIDNKGYESIRFILYNSFDYSTKVRINSLSPIDKSK